MKSSEGTAWCAGGGCGPVAGELAGSDTGLNLLVGYDLLVSLRPPTATTALSAARTDRSVRIVNRGMASVERSDGRQCDGGNDKCASLPAKRLYAGAEWQQRLPRSGSGQYRARSIDGWTTIRF